MAPLLALLSAGFFGAADFAGGFATRRLPVVIVTLVTSLVGLLLSVALVAIFGGTWSSAALGWGAASGAFGLGGLVLLYLGLSIGPNRVVSPLSAVVGAVFPVVVGLATGERPDRYAIVGLLLAAPAIWLVAGGHLRGFRTGDPAMLYGLGAGLGFGLFFVCLAQSPSDAGAIPLVAARAMSTTLLVIAAVRVRPALPQVESLRLPVLAGVLDMAANGFFLWASRAGDLTVVAALTSLYPVMTVILAITVLHERLSRSQAIGLVLAVASAVLLS